MTDNDPIYREMDLHNHISKRPDTYVGSMELQKIDLCIRRELYCKKKNRSVGAFLRIYIEIISNAVDNFLRSKSTDSNALRLVLELVKKDDNMPKQWYGNSDKCERKWNIQW